MRMQSRQASCLRANCTPTSEHQVPVASARVVAAVNSVQKLRGTAHIREQLWCSASATGILTRRSRRDILSVRSPCDNTAALAAAVPFQSPLIILRQPSAPPSCLRRAAEVPADVRDGARSVLGIFEWCLAS
jgi:hypothetical protein